MKLTCSKSDLLLGIMTVQRAAAVKSTVTVLEGILFETYKDVLKLVGTDLDLGIENFINAKITEEGRVVLPSRLIGDIVRKLPDGEVSISMNSDNSVVISCQNSKTTIQGISADEYPELPKVQEDNEIEISQQLFHDLIKQTIFAVAVDETRPILTGLLLETNNDEINMVALDGFRLALCKGKLGKSYDPVQAVIPGKSLAEISKVLNPEQNNVSITITNTHFLVDMGYTRIVSRLLEGKFINYKQILPNEFQSNIKIDRKMLLDSIDRASLMAREEKNNLVKFHIQDEKVIITSNSELGNVYEEVPVTLDGKELEIAFNAKYFSDVLKNTDDEYLMLYFNSSVSPCIIRPVEGDKFIYLILPVRIFNG